MFTGIITHTGLFQSARKVKSGLLLHIKLRQPMKRLNLGESIAVNGICLTLHEKKGNNLFFYLLEETFRLTNIRFLRLNAIVNLERSLSLSDHLGGHLVTGHIDGVGVLKKIVSIRGKDENEMLIAVPDRLMPYVAPKGSISVDGISLTIGKTLKNKFWIYLVKYTLEHTNLGLLKEGAHLNLEVDIIARYVENLSKYKQDKTR